MRKILFCAILLVLSLCIISSCGSDLPPDDNTPEPPVFNGVYSSEFGTFSFNGDGKTIVVDVKEDFASNIGLPSSNFEGNYVFLFRNEIWRYDKAETFRIILNKETYQFRNDIGKTNENEISFYLPDNSLVSFKKNT